MLSVLSCRMPRLSCLISPVMRSAFPMKTRSVFARANAASGSQSMAATRRTGTRISFTRIRSGDGFFLVGHEVEDLRQHDADDHAGGKDPQKIHRAHVADAR